MSTTPNPEQEPQQWRTYPGNPDRGSEPQPRAEASEGERPSFRSYEEYASAKQSRPPLQPYSGPENQQPPKDRLHQKWMWIVFGVIAAFIITGVARSGNWVTLLIFAAIAWWILSRRKK